MPKTLKDEQVVRINVLLPESERTAFDRWCRYGASPKVSMNMRIRQLLRADSAGKVSVSRNAEPLVKGDK